MDSLDISIYVPVYNGEKTITNCLDSIFNQTLIPKKVLVVNDNSTDNTKKLLENYKNKIEIINNKQNLGISLTRDIAINHLNTKYIASVDSDVEIEKNWLKNILYKLKKNNATWVCGKMYEKYTEKPCNLWRSLRLRQNWGETDVINPKFVFGCNNILKTESIELDKIYKNYGEYFKTNGDDNELTKYLREREHILYYDSSAICYHLLNDDYKSLASRYSRYIYYGDGLKKRNLTKTLKNIMRSIKKTLFWNTSDIFNLRFSLLKVNIILMYYLIKIDIQRYINDNE